MKLEAVIGRPVLLLALSCLTYTRERSPSGSAKITPALPARVEAREVAQKQSPPPADAAYFEASKIRGCKLLAAMGSLDKDAAALFEAGLKNIQSPWKDFPGDFEKWGYAVERNLAMKWFGDEPKIEEALAYYKLDTKKDIDGGLNIVDGWEHLVEKEIDGVTYRTTFAQFTAVFNIDQGVLVAWYRFGPRMRGVDWFRPPITIIPKLKNWSDIGFLQYLSAISKRQKVKPDVQIAPLKYFIAASVVNEKTLGVLGTALAPKDKRKDALQFDYINDCKNFKWENRKWWGMDTNEGQALLGSENGRGFGYFLAQHKATFGDKTTVTGVTVWCGYSEFSTFGHVNLLFHVSDPVWEPVVTSSAVPAPTGPKV